MRPAAAALPRGWALRPLTEQDRPQAWDLGRLAFGGDPDRPPPPPPAASRSWGVFSGDELLAKAALLPFTQWWGGGRVPCSGVAGVAVHPAARGSGAAAALFDALVREARAAGSAVSALWPTAPGIYRSRGWEVVGVQEDTAVPVDALARPAPDGVVLRRAEHADLPALTAVWRAEGERANGRITRDGPAFPQGLAPVLEQDVVTVAEQDGQVRGFVAYRRGRGYDTRETELVLGDLVATTPAAERALLASLGSWRGVVGTVRWTAPAVPLARQLPGTLPAPLTRRPWMLRVLDAPAAVRARGYRGTARTTAAFRLSDPLVPEHEGVWELRVDGGRGELVRGDGPAPTLDVRGLALLWAGVAGPADLARDGLLEHDVPGLDVFDGPAPDLGHDF